MAFEFDEGKNKANKAKHGIDFVAAQALWEDVDALEVPAQTQDEPRSIVLGRIGAKLWSAVITRRGERIRIISVRRARNEERDLYES
jgi:uncharacterized DUF497 family protein